MNNDINLIYEAYKGLNESVGLGPMVGKMVKVPGPGSQNTASKVVVLKVDDEEDYSEDAENYDTEEETVYIQAGEQDDDCGCNDHDNEDDYDGELDMARAELLKANEYSAKLFDMLGNLDSLEGWTASKITKASDYLSSVFHYLDYEAMDVNVEDEEDDYELDDFDETQTAKDTGFGGA